MPLEHGIAAAICRTGPADAVQCRQAVPNGGQGISL